MCFIHKFSTSSDGRTDSLHFSDPAHTVISIPGLLTLHQEANPRYPVFIKDGTDGIDPDLLFAAGYISCCEDSKKENSDDAVIGHQGLIETIRLARKNAGPFLLAVWSLANYSPYQVRSQQASVSQRVLYKGMYESTFLQRCGEGKVTNKE